MEAAAGLALVKYDLDQALRLGRKERSDCRLESSLVDLQVGWRRQDLARSWLQGLLCLARFLGSLENGGKASDRLED